ncbi:MAG: radical SAM protein [Nitrososphaeria archaeon]
MGLTFGPVPSRRLGRSLGVNNIPPKFCTYSCIYCQIGITKGLTCEIREFYEPGKIVESIMRELNKGEKIDYVTFVPDGEPTLDINLGREIRDIKDAGARVAVITNASLLFHDDVREALSEADWVSVKVDACTERTWKKLNRPCRELEFKMVMDGILTFSREYRNVLCTETMLVSGYNEGEIEGIANFISELKPEKAYISVPTRPPALSSVKKPDEESVNRAYNLLSRMVNDVELLTGYEGNDFSSSGKVEDDLLSITSVHPMREDAVAELLKRHGRSWDLVESLLEKKLLKEVKYEGRKYYIRAFS